MAKALGKWLAAAIFGSSFCILLLWGYMLWSNTNKAKLINNIMYKICVEGDEKIYGKKDTTSGSKKHPDHDPDTDGAKLFEKLAESAKKPAEDYCWRQRSPQPPAVVPAGEPAGQPPAVVRADYGAVFKQLVAHRDDPSLLNSILKDDFMIKDVAERLKLIGLIVRCKPPLDLQLVDNGAFD